MSDAAAELRAALLDEESFLAWLARRGYAPLPDAPPLPQRGDLSRARYAHAPDHARAPRILVLWTPELGERDWHGARLRRTQADAAEYRLFLAARGLDRDAPALVLVACPAFLVAFEVSDAFARRRRFSVKRLALPGTPLVEAYERLNAGWMARQAREEVAPTASDPDDPLADLLAVASDNALKWDLKQIFIGERFDDEFVSFMGAQRRRIAEIVLDPSRREVLLDPVWRALRAGLGSDAAHVPLPPLEQLIRERRLRNGLMAAIDTVLLRLVLYRYLDAQHAVRPTDEERRSMAMGSYDELLERTVHVDREALVAALKRARKDYQPVAVQVGLFGGRPAARVKDSAAFSDGVRARAEQYQAAARGDLHQGAVADAADLIQEHLLRFHAEGFAELLAGTSTDTWSFHYADLDPRAFQEFYQQTIGTDVRFTYDPRTGTARVAVEEVQRTRKEQGAYYTAEDLCRWLVERTLGERFRVWVDAWRAAREAERELSAADRIARATARLVELSSWRILDPTCGGGIFLRVAFAWLQGIRPRVTTLIAELPEGVRREVLRAHPARLFAEGAELGEWEWHILLHMLYGVDIDVKALNVASNLLTLSALSYKPHGLCFPSFVNTSLKHGNALVVPLREEERADLLQRSHDDLLRLIDLRGELRDPNLDRDVWRRKHAEAATLTRLIAEPRIVLAYKALFPDLTETAVLARVQRVGSFCYEVEFPEVFFEVRLAGKEKSKRRLTLRENPGFDVVLGNPPWEVPAKQYKQFLPDFDPEYRNLKGQASIQREQELLADPEIRHRWIHFQESVDDYKAILASGWYKHVKSEVKGVALGVHSNLYKYAVELAWRMSRRGGLVGLIVEGGLWQDMASVNLRRLLLDQSETRAVCGFINSGIFHDIDNRIRFSATVFRRGGRTETLRAVFMREAVADLERFEALAVAMDVGAIRADPSELYPVPEMRSEEHAGAQGALTAHPLLEDAAWAVDTYSRELHAEEQRKFFDQEPGPTHIPILSGAQFNLFGVHQGALPEVWLDLAGAGGDFLRARQEGRVLDAIAAWLEARGQRPRGGKREAALAWVKSRTGEARLPAEWVRLDNQGFRLAWRDIARNNDKRTLIAAILPPGVALSHKAPFVRPFRLTVGERGVSWPLQYPLDQLLYLAGMLSSFAADSVVRTRLAKTNLTSAAFAALPVPAWTGTPAQRRVAELCARLTGSPATPARPWADATPLLAAVGLRPEDALLDPAARADAEVELNAAAARLYGLGPGELRFLMDTLFMTREHRHTHAGLRDAVAARMEGA